MSNVDVPSKAAEAVKKYFEQRYCAPCPSLDEVQESGYYICPSIIQHAKGLARAVLDGADYDLLRRIADVAATAHKRWSTWRGSEASAMAELGELLEEWKSRRGGLKGSKP